MTVVKPKMANRCINQERITLMNSVVKPSKMPRPVSFASLDQSDLKIAVQSALAAAFCLGLPTGLFFWLITLQKSAPSPEVDRLVTFFSRNLVPPILLGRIGAFVWGLLLSKISGYRQWWWPALASLAGFWLGDSVLYRGWLPEGLPALFPGGLAPPLQFGIVLAMTVLSVTVCAGVLLGFTLLSWKASLMLAVTTGSAATLAAVITLMILHGLGVQVGGGNAAMPKATAVATMAAALAGGVVLAVVFSRYVRTGSSDQNVISDQTSTTGG